MPQKQDESGFSPDPGIPARAERRRPTQADSRVNPLAGSRHASPFTLHVRVFALHGGTVMGYQFVMAQKITPFLWFNGRAEQAAKFYTSIFKNSKIIRSSQMSARFRLDGQDFIALNGGPQFKFTPAISFLISCKNQDEVDYFWKRLSSGGKIQECGWLIDKFGISWQVVPSILGDLLQDKDDAKADRVMQAMLKMKKLDFAKLKKAAAGG